MISNSPNSIKVPENKYAHFKKNVGQYEYILYRLLDNNSEINFIPKFYSYDKQEKILKTRKIYGMNIADIYTENFNELPVEIIEKIRNIITFLYNIGIIYPEITGYNFIKDNKSKIWIVNFKHCFICKYKEDEESLNSEQKQHLEFVRSFISGGENNWNPYFE